ncbi:hypothetical protein INR49_024551 [Caranx melampygus]|nr:hypothetical protein INR49_024551 [Caranx melampygus]
MQDMQQQHHRALDDISLPSLHTHSDDIQSIIHRIKSAEIAHLLHNKYPERELELHKCVWEEKGEKVEERWRAREKEQKQNQTGSQTQIQEGKKVAVVNWWKALSVEGAKARTKETQWSQELSETRAKLQRAEQTITDMREQVCHLQASLRSAQECVTDQKHSSSVVLHIDKGTNTEREEASRGVGKVVKEQRDAAVVTEITGGAASQQEQTQLQVTADGLLATLRRMEAMVNNALETAELVRESEQRVSQVRVRMESIAHRVEEALGRAANTDEQLNALEARIQERAPNQSPGPSLPADPGSDAACFTAEPNVELEQRERTESSPPSREIPEVSEPPQLAMNGGTGPGSCSKLQEDDGFSLLGSPLVQSDSNSRESCDCPCTAEGPFIFPHTRSRPSLPPAMPTLPEEEEDSPEELDSSSSSPSTTTPGEARAVVMTAPTIVYPQQATIIQQDGRPLEQARPHSPRARLARNSSGGPITTVDSTGNVIDLVKDQLPELQLSEEDRQKNLELLEQAKKVSDRFLTRRGRRSTSSLTDSPTGPSPTPTPSSSPCSSRSSSLTVAPQTVGGPSELTHVSSQSTSQGRLLVDWKPSEKRKVSSGTLTPRFAVQKETCDPAVPKSPSAVNKADEGAGSGPNPNQAPATGVAKPVPDHKLSRYPVQRRSRPLGPSLH